MTTDTAAQAAREPALSDWLAQRLGTSGPFEARAIIGGNSNETALLTAPGGRRILHRPPATANDLGREFRVLTAGRPGHPAPQALAYAPAGDVSPFARFFCDSAVSRIPPARQPAAPLFLT